MMDVVERVGTKTAQASVETPDTLRDRILAGLEKRALEVASRKMAVFVRQFFDDIVMYRQRGLSWDDITEVFAENGVQIKKATLRNAYVRISAEREKGRARTSDVTKKAMAPRARAAATPVEPVKVETVEVPAQQPAAVVMQPETPHKAAPESEALKGFESVEAALQWADGLVGMDVAARGRILEARNRAIVRAKPGAHKQWALHLGVTEHGILVDVDTGHAYRIARRLLRPTAGRDPQAADQALAVVEFKAILNSGRIGLVATTIDVQTGLGHGHVMHGEDSASTMAVGEFPYELSGDTPAVRTKTA